MDNCLLFGARGHLSRTKIIPQLKKQNIPYVPISRSKKESLSHLEPEQNHVAYMSIPTGDVVSSIEPYAFDFLRIRPTIILEKPHGYSHDNFLELCNYLDFFGHDYLFCDHYMFKDEMINIDTYGINFSDVNYVNVTIREEGCVNDRIGYFDKTGIILDMYQSHVVMMFAHILSRVYPGDEPSRILEELAHTKYSVVDSKKYDTYAGTQHTQCRIFTKYRNTNLSCELEKNAHKGEKAVYAQTSSRMHKIYIHSDGYDNVVESLVTGKTDYFLSKHDVDCLWRHIKLR